WKSIKGFSSAIAVSGRKIGLCRSFALETALKSATMSSTDKIEVSLLQRILWICNMFYYQILAIVSILFLWIFFDQANSFGSTFTLHLVLSTAAYIPLMAAAIILFSEDNMITLYIPRTKRYWIHGGLLLLSCIFVTIGIAVETDSKTKHGRDHFVSKHAILGLVSWILVFASIICGVVAANTRTFSRFIRPVFAKLVHNFLGLAGFSIGVASLWEMLGHIERYLSDSAFIGLKYGLAFVTIWSGLAAIKSLFGQVKGVFS
ncbi:hypothetical protein YQE_08825, partial [Dendroctonus ponderosae]